MELLQVSDLEYTDVLQYYYLGGVIFAALRRYDEAEEFLETVHEIKKKKNISLADMLDLYRQSPRPPTLHPQFN